MKKVILIFVTIVLSGLLYAKDNKSTDALLREIDGIIKNRQTYGAEKEARIADLKKFGFVFCLCSTERGTGASHG